MHHFFAVVLLSNWRCSNSVITKLFLSDSFLTKSELEKFKILHKETLTVNSKMWATSTAESIHFLKWCKHCLRVEKFIPQHASNCFDRNRSVYLSNALRYSLYQQFKNVLLLAGKALMKLREKSTASRNTLELIGRRKFFAPTGLKNHEKRGVVHQTTSCESSAINLRSRAVQLQNGL